MNKANEIKRWRKRVGTHAASSVIKVPVVLPGQPQGAGHFVQAVINRWNHLSRAEKILYLTLFLVATGATILVAKFIAEEVIRQLGTTTSNDSQMPPIMFFNNQGAHQNYNSSKVKAEVGRRTKSVAIEREKAMNNVSIEDLTSNINIDFDLNTLVETTHTTKEIIHSLNQLVKNEMPKASHPAVLGSILKSPTFKIQLAGSDKFYELAKTKKEKTSAGIPYGAYLPRSDTMYFFLHADSKKAMREYRRIVHNECSHAASTRTNAFFTGELIHYPVLDADGSFSAVLTKELIHALNAAHMRVMRFVDLFSKLTHKKQINSAENDLLQKLNSVIVTYEPLGEHKLLVPKSELGSYVSKKLGGVYYLSQQLYGLVNQVVEIEVPIKEMIAKEQHVILILNPYEHFRSLGFGNLISFLYDHFRKMGMYINQDYGVEAGKRRQSFELATEILSSYEECSHDLLMLIGPEICDYLTQYHEVDDYCLSNKQKS